MKIKIWIIMAASLLLFNIHALGWDNTLTHPHITLVAIESSSFDQNLKDRLKISGGKNEIFDGRSLTEWLQCGAMNEDIPACRASNHFHNPYLSWRYAGLTDTWWLTDLWCWGLGLGQYPPDEIRSNITWASGYLNDTDLDQESIEYNEWDWLSARQYFHTYLTGRDSEGLVVAPDHTGRNDYMVKTLQALGQVMHLLQDTAVPAHVRNDFSQGHTMVSPGPEVPWKWIGNGFEKYVERNDNSGWFNLAPAEPNFDDMRITKLWDTDQLSYAAAPTDQAGLGLAEYASMNFLSEYRMFDPEFPYPSPEHCVVAALAPIDVLTPLDRQYLSSENGHPGKQIKHLAIVSYLKYFQEVYLPNVSSDKIPLWFDENCYNEYAENLVPRAIGYSAKILDYFFRGDMDMVRDEETGSGYLIVNNIQEDMEGLFELYYDNETDQRIKLWEQDLALGATGAANDKSPNIYFNEPSDAKNPGQYILAFRGRLGSEPDAVTGKIVELANSLKFHIRLNGYTPTKSKEIRCSDKTGRSRSYKTSDEAPDYVDLSSSGLTLPITVDLYRYNSDTYTELFSFWTPCSALEAGAKHIPVNWISCEGFAGKMLDIDMGYHAGPSDNYSRVLYKRGGWKIINGITYAEFNDLKTIKRSYNWRELSSYYNCESCSLETATGLWISYVDMIVSAGECGFSSCSSDEFCDQDVHLFRCGSYATHVDQEGSFVIQPVVISDEFGWNPNFPTQYVNTLLYVESLSLWEWDSGFIYETNLCAEQFNTYIPWDAFIYELADTPPDRF